MASTRPRSNSLSSLREAPATPADLLRDGGLLVLRLATGGTMLLAHGLPMLLDFSELSSKFSDPLGVGSTVSLTLTVFAEAFCAAAILVGLVTRAAAGVLAFTMLVAFAIVHSGDPFGDRELAMMYAALGLVLVLTGPGRFSLDRLIFGSRARGSLKLAV